MNTATKDGLAYAGGLAAGTILAKSFGAKALGVAMGGFGGLAFAAWWLLKKPKLPTT
jgi:hypothetical protein